MPLLSSSKVQPEVLKDKVFLAIRDAILAGEIRPGERLIEGHLIRQLGVSRAPLRDAFWALEKQGYIRMTPHRGTFVIQLSSEEVQNIYDVRKVLESFAMREARSRARAEDLAELREIFDWMQKTARDGDLMANFKVDLQFHQKIWSLSGNQKVEEILTNVCPSLFTYLLIRYQSSPSFMSEGLSSHEEILHLLECDLPPAEVEARARVALDRVGEITEDLLRRVS